MDFRLVVYGLVQLGFWHKLQHHLSGIMELGLKFTTRFNFLGIESS
jgi:hypothetical protein